MVGCGFGKMVERTMVHRVNPHTLNLDKLYPMGKNVQFCTFREKI